jgi:hypothetical protein
LLRLLGKGYVAVDLSTGDRVSSPVHVVWHDDDDEQRARVAWPSIRSFIEAVIGRFEDGTYFVGGGLVDGPMVDDPNR